LYAVVTIGKTKNTNNYFPNNYSNKINNTSEKFSKQCKNYKQIYQNVFGFKCINYEAKEKLLAKCS
jgi:hypothetical protein